jgi:hypothetical protein
MQRVNPGSMVAPTTVPVIRRTTVSTISRAVGSSGRLRLESELPPSRVCRPSDDELTTRSFVTLSMT